jgi:hypothetical protein
LAKIIYDGFILNQDFKNVKTKIIENYSGARDIKRDELEEKISAFLPIIPLEHSSSLLTRKPDNYEVDLLRDIYFIQTLYEEEK